MKVVAYRKQSDDPAELDLLLKGLNLPGCNECILFTDSDRDFLAYRELKKEIEGENALVIIAALRDIGRNKAEVLAELQWYYENNINILVGGFPTMQRHPKGKDNRMALSMLIDICDTLLDEKVFDIRDAAQSRNGGRHKVAFPDGFEELYARWKAGEITALVFMKETGLKKGTFYNLVNEYSYLLGHMKEVRKIG